MSFDFWGGALCGALFISLLVLGAYYIGPLPPEHAELLTNLVTVVAALLGSLVVFFTTRHQMNHQREQDLASARAVLPLVLSRVCSSCKSAVQFFGDPSSQANLARWDGIDQSFRLSSEDLDALRDMIRVADPLTRDWLTILIARYQVVLARSNDFLSNHHPNRQRGGSSTRILLLSPPSELFDWSALHAIAENMFEFARGGKTSVGPCLDPDRLDHAIRYHDIDMTFDTETEKRRKRFVESFGDGSIEKFRFRPS